MSSTNPLHNHLNHLPLQRLGDERPAGLLITSLPLPRQATLDLSLDGRAGYAKAIGQWPDAPEGGPRRLLMVADGGEAAPAQLAVIRGNTRPQAAPPAAEMQFIARNDGELLIWEKHALKISWGGHTVEIIMGLRTGGEVHWWEACRLVTLEETDACRTVEMGGAIPVEEYGLELFTQGLGYNNPYLHKHNWLNGHILARLHANGVCEVFAHHINSKFFDDGRSFEDVVPVIGFRTEQGCQGIAELAGDWDGTQTEFALGAVRFDMTEVAHLATPEQPGNVREEQGFVALQPYLGVEVYGGICPQTLTGDPYAIHAEEQRFPRGMARTLRFSFSLSPDRAPAVVRYLAPAWWYGACEEFMPAPLLPVSNEYDHALHDGAQWVLRTINRGGFEDGCVPRGEGHRDTLPRHEPGWEGEIPYAQLLSAWRNGDADEYDCALRSAYFVTDIVMDHAAKAARMHGYPPPYAFALPHARLFGTIAAYLETGDKYLLDTARAVTENSYWIHKNSWPRLAIGRDALFIRGAIFLYRYFGETHYLTIARDALRDVAAVQRPNGSFGDQGGGSGIHQWGGYVTKPWMGFMAMGGVLDYLELFPDDDQLLACAKRFADWLMEIRFDHDGVMGWSYQHDYAGGRTFIDGQGNIVKDVLPGKKLWHMDYLARLAMFCSLRFDNPDYFTAWEESFRARDRWGSDHAVAQAVMCVTWLQAKLWNARITEDGIVAHPVWLGDRTPLTAAIHTPGGPAMVLWEDQEHVLAPDDIRIADIRTIQPGIALPASER